MIAFLRRSFKTGDSVVFCKTKHGSRPGPRARDVEPSPHGEDYTYHVDKYWTVSEARADGKLVVVTRRGKQHVLDATDPQLRRAWWWERFLYAHRFPKLD